MLETTQKKDYDFADRDHKAVLSQDELKHFDEGMRLKNDSSPAGNVDFAGAVQSVIRDMDMLMS